jgi:hypothetical protein
MQLTVVFPSCNAWSAACAPESGWPTAAPHGTEARQTNLDKSGNDTSLKPLRNGGNKQTGRTVMMNMTKWLCAILIAGSTLAWAETSNTELLERYRKIYDDTAAEYESVYRMANQAWPIDYIEALQTLQAKLQSLGNLDAWEAVSEELNRFRRDMSLTETVPSPAELCEIQNAYRSHVEQLASEKSAKLEDLRIKYVTRLAALQREWTQQGKFNHAFKARDEIERVGGPQEEPVAVEEPEAFPEPRARASAATAIPTEAVTHADGTVVYPSGVAAPSERGVVFKTELLSSTDHSPWSPSVSVKLWETSDKASDSFERDQFVGTVDGKVKSDTRFVRAALRMAKSGVQQRDLELRVEYYAKPAGGSGDARLAATRHVGSPVLDTRLVYVDVAPVSIDSLSRSISIGPFGEHSKTVGDKFYGYIVSVLDATGALLYQGASSSTLAKQATIPEPKKQFGRERPFAPEGDDAGEKADTQALHAELEAASMALREAKSSPYFKKRGPGGREAIREAEQRLRRAQEAIREAEKEKWRR